MENAQVSTAKLSSETPVFFPHRRRHLRSKTVRTLLRIFSQCYDESRVSRNLDNDRNTENGSHGQESEPAELASERAPQVNTSGVEKVPDDGRLSEQMAINQIEQLMGLEENEDSLNETDLNLGSFSEKMLIDELENIVQGCEDIDRENNVKPLKENIIQKQSGIVDSSNTKGKHVTFQQLDLSGNLSQKLECLDKEGDDQSLISVDSPRNIGSESNNSIISVFGEYDVVENQTPLFSDEIIGSVGTKAVVGISNSNESNKTSARTKDDSDIEEMVCEGDMVDIGKPTIAGIEEGEISGGYCEGDMDMLLQEPEMQNREVNDVPVKDGNELICNRSELEDPFTCVDVVDKNVKLLGPLESDKNKAVYAHDGVAHEKTLAVANGSVIEAQTLKMENSAGNRSLVAYEDILEVAGRNKTSIEKDVEVHPKRHRGPVSKEKRAKKKAKERKRRAENNRKLGVKRLKLEMVSKPKPIQFCRHYLHGRCQEGEKCKFSHDTVPLTKSKPCCHFVHNSCMKGDDCPFDHQLSKYPCTNFASKGFCSRGDDCLFSHKIPSVEDTPIASNAGEPKKLENNDVSCISAKISSHKSVEKNSNETILKQSKLVNKGTCFLSVGDSSLVDKLKRQNLLPCGNTGVKTGDHINQQGSQTVQNSNEVLNRTPHVGTPKGINFLPFGRAQSDGKLPSSFSSGDNRVKLSDFGNSDTPNQSSSTPLSDSKSKGIQSSVVSKGINFLSFGSIQCVDSSGGKLTSSFLSVDNSVKLSAFNSSNTPNQCSSVLFPDSTPKGIQPPVAPKGANFFSVGNASTKMPNQISSADSMPMGIQPVLPNGVNFLSFGKTSIDDSSNKGKSKLTEDGIDGTDSCVKIKQQNVLYEPPKSGSNSLALSSSPSSLIQSSRIYKTAPKSAQKAILSTLAFAAQYESRMKSTQATHAPVIGKEVDTEPLSKGTIDGSSANLSKSSNTLEVLSNMGSKDEH